MLKGALALVICTCLMQQLPGPQLGHVVIHSRFNTSIIFEYAAAFLPEDEPINDSAVDNFRSGLLSTGLFTGIRIEVVPVQSNPGKADVYVFPTWHPKRNSFTIHEVLFDGFTGIDEGKVRAALARKGVGPRSPLLKYPLQTIRRSLDEAIKETYQNDPDTMHNFEALLVTSSFRIEPVAPLQFKLIVCSMAGGC